ncbi:MAG: 50S ribosomal protein L16, partial [Deltaproteobacteria bacterium]|nr:50S ribosomal protein L16 [Deltaproteobacteria bacterium]
MLAPTRIKHRKVQKGKRRGTARRGNEVSFGDFALMATDDGWLTSRQIEAARVAIMRGIRRFGWLWIRVFPDKPISIKPAETRMGKGKGAPEFWVAVVKPGRVLYEVGGAPEDIVREAFRVAAHKLPIKTKFVK